MSNKFSNVRT